ncbi:single-stranded DNA-binding protein [Pedobacter flavus]|uniref:Single-stranded DNA-binding protein n=1 Tax=Pedobacter flavus TaxID=3113906 RepID=A0ABU7GY68_9SPHI|nr:single-stranded DNA-binding protein [Pedobacter sp. VNH31]MEE1883956.1 single-stranded DNA-binding protein [Pedobacter sp. VNH31]
MKYSENKVELTGFAGNDVELKVLANDKRLSKVNIAVNESYISTVGAEVKNTQWFNLIFWNNLADEAAEKIKKGSKLSITGRLVSQQYEKDGIKKYSFEIVVSEFQTTTKEG